ncbi:MAG TPA: gamma-glutamylcyclotransferase family protein, partial [Blastocatellia bacterium]|nr:gamma-glutamylcyclotransferase family protein [Blastocatellia bacterium]
ATPASLQGWSRDWSHRISITNGKLCALSVTPDPGCCIEGVVLSLGENELIEMDRREIGYERVPVTVQTLGPGTGSSLDCAAYVGLPAFHGPATVEYPIWRSYLDCVMAGYIELGGPEAAERFVTSTRGWPAPILNDRRSPKYPRAVRLTQKMQEIVDDILRTHRLLEMLFS